MRPGLLVDAVALAVSAAASAAQIAVPEGASVVHGVVLDQATGRGVPEAWVCARIRIGESDTRPLCTSADSTGGYRLGGLPAGPVRMDIACPTAGPDDRTLATATVSIPDSATVERGWRVPAQRCRSRGRRLAAGDLAGHYTAGFETSLFVPCPADRWPGPRPTTGDAAADPHQAWVRPRDTAVFGAVTWPPAPADGSGALRYFVRWRGTVEGPGRYGHLGTAAFRITVDSVLEVRAPSDDDCGPAARGEA